MPDRIEIRGLRVMARHGVLLHEQQRAQPFEVDLDVEADLRTAGESDRLEDTVSYSEIAKVAAETVANESHQLLECVAERIAGAVLGFKGVDAITVTVRKLRPPAQLDLITAGVTITRGRL